MMRPSRVWLLSMIGHSAMAVPSLFAILTLTTNTNSVAIPFATTDYDKITGAAQLIKTSANTLTIRSTTGAWTLTVRALAATFAFAPSAGDPNPSKPAGDLAVRAPATSATWLVLTTTNQVLSTGPQAAGNQTRALDYRLNSNLNNNPPGTYTISVIYTLTSP